MKRYITCLLAPLLVFMLSAFTPSNVVEKQRENGRDSTVVNVQFSPAKLIVTDSRTAVDATSIIKGNTESNLQIATAIEKIAIVLDMNERGRRCESYMDQITQLTGKSVEEIEKIIHKKRVYDMIFYTLFIIILLYFWYAITQFTAYAKSINSKEFLIRMTSYIMLFIIMVLLFKYGDGLLNKDYHLIDTIINASPG